MSNEFHVRPSILKLHDLKMSMFPNQAEAFAAADNLIAEQRARWPAIPNQFPDRIFDNPLLSQYYFIKAGDSVTENVEDHKQGYHMNSGKLNSQSLLMIKNSGMVSIELGMSTPHVVDLVDVKKEFAEISDLEKMIKQLRTSSKFTCG